MIVGEDAWIFDSFQCSFEIMAYSFFAKLITISVKFENKNAIGLILMANNEPQ